jgi:hypothetical protein
MARNSDAFRLAGLGRRHFHQQVADMIAGAAETERRALSRLADLRHADVLPRRHLTEIHLPSMRADPPQRLTVIV